MRCARFFAVRSRQTKHELPASCILGLRPRFLRGILRGVSIFVLENVLLNASEAAVLLLLLRPYGSSGH